MHEFTPVQLMAQGPSPQVMVLPVQVLMPEHSTSHAHPAGHVIDGMLQPITLTPVQLITHVPSDRHMLHCIGHVPPIGRNMLQESG